MNNTQDFLELEYLRLDAYRLLADSYHQPEQRLLDNLGQLTTCLERFSSDAGQYINRMIADVAGMKDLQTLEVDYARLFVGPFNLLAPPYGSVYLEGERQVMGASTADVEKRYRAVGLDVDTGFKDAPDHIAAELEFMHFLIFKAMEAAGKGDADHLAASLTNQQAFLEIHLGAWVHEFAGKIVENAATSFYRNLARATEAFIKADYHFLMSVLPALSSGHEKCTGPQSISGYC